MSSMRILQNQNRTDYKVRLPIVSMVLGATCALIFWIFGAIPSTLILHSDEGQRAWQWLSSHWVHISEQHLIWNLAAFLILGSLIEQTSRRLVLGALGLGIVGVNFYLALFFSLDAYAGLSGVLNSLLVIALYCLYQRPDYRAAAVITLLLSIAKIIVEILIQDSLFSKLPWPPVPQAHLAGMIGGLLLVLALEIRKRRLLNSQLVNFES